MNTTRYFAAIVITGLLMLLSSDSSLWAHQAPLYKAAFQAFEKDDLDNIKDFFSKDAWEGNNGVLSADELKECVKNVEFLLPLGKVANSKVLEYANIDRPRLRDAICVWLN